MNFWWHGCTRSKGWGSPGKLSDGVLPAYFEGGAGFESAGSGVEYEAGSAPARELPRTVVDRVDGPMAPAQPSKPRGLGSGVVAGQRELAGI